MQKTIVWLIIIGLVIVGAIFGYQRFGGEKELPYELVNVIRGNITEEVFETGTVKMAEEIDLGFENVGRIEKIYVKVGEAVRAGQNLAKLETGQLEIQLREAEGSLELAQAKLNQLLAGASEEEIKVLETKVANAEIAVEDAELNLKNVKDKAEVDLANLYNNVPDTLNDAYTKADDAVRNKTDIMFNNDNTASPDLAFSTIDSTAEQNAETKRFTAGNELKSFKSELNILSSSDYSQLDQALISAENHLEIVRDFLQRVNDAVSGAVGVSAANLDTYRSNLNTARTNVDTAISNISDKKQDISAQKSANQKNITSAETTLNEAKSALSLAQEQLNLGRAGPRQVDIDLYQAQIKQAQAKVDLLKEQIEEALLKSPIRGVVTQINKKGGETVQIADWAISLISSDDFQIEVDIYEEDIVKVKVNDPVDIALTAFPGKVFKGKVVSVDPAEKLIEGVVYYEVNITFDEAKEGIKAGMTADLVIKTASKSNVLIIPEDAIKEKEGKKIVRVLKEGVVEEREIEAGLMGSDDMVEIISGLKEGEKVILKEKY